MTPGPEDIHDLTFEWTSQLEGGGSGLGLVHTSLTGPERAEWGNQLVNRVSVPPGDTEPSTCYLLVRDRAVLVHRMPVRDQLNRESTRTRALIGPPSLLTFARAVALRPDDPPADADGPFGDYPAAWEKSSDSDRTLAALAAPHREAVIRLVADVLGRSDRDSYAVSTHGLDARVLLWAAERCFDNPRWTFSLRERNTAATGLPMFVFTTDRQPARSSFGSPRVWLDLSLPTRASPRLQREAAQRVDAVLADRYREVGSRSAAIRLGRDGAPTATGSAPAPPPPGPATPAAAPEQRRRRPPALPERLRSGRVPAGLRTRYAARLTMLIGWSAIFIVLLAVAGRVQP